MSYYKSEFPDYDRKLIIPDGFEDNSWHNDMMPHVEKTLPCDIRVIIWQDYNDVELREIVDGKQFIFQLEVGYNTFFEYETNKWSKIEKLIKSLQ